MAQRSISLPEHFLRFSYPGPGSAALALLHRFEDDLRHIKAGCALQAIESGRRIGLAHPVAVAIEPDIDPCHIELACLRPRFGDADDLAIERERQCRAAERNVRLAHDNFRAPPHGGDSLPLSPHPPPPPP